MAAATPKATAISVAYLVYLERDRHKPSDEVLIRKANVLQPDLDLLYFVARSNLDTKG